MNNTLEGINSRIMEADGEGNGTPLQYSCLENPWWGFTPGGSLVGCCLCGRTELDTTDVT